MDTALFSAGNLFAGDDSDDSADSAGDCSFVERDHEFPGMILRIREFTFHQVNANLLWPGTRIFAEWLVKHPSLLSRRRILELGSGTGALTIFLRKIYDLDITTSDYDDEDIEKNIHHNHVANDVPDSPHIRHTWGDTFPSECADWDLIIANDILLYVKQYANLVKTLVFLLESWRPKAVGMEILPSGSSVVADRAQQAGDHLGSNTVEEIQNDKRNNVVPVPLSLPKPCFLMSWRRRIPKDDEDLFFQGCKAAGLCVADYGARVYCIYPHRRKPTGNGHADGNLEKVLTGDFQQPLEILPEIDFALRDVEGEMDVTSKYYVDSNVPLPYEMLTQSDFPTNNSHDRLFNVLRNQCTPIQVEATASSQSPEVKASVAKPRDETTLDRSGWDKFKSSYEQNLHVMLKHHKGKGKNINAEKDVLSTYHDSYLYGEVPLTIKVRAAIRGWPLKYILLWLEFMAAMLSVALYIVSTYRVDRISQEKPWIRMVEMICGGFFMVDYFIKIYSAPVRLYYVFSTKGLVDLISTLPIILSLGARERYSGAEILLFLRALRVMPVISSAGGFTGSIKEQIFILVMYTLGVVFIAGGLLQWVEYRATPESVRQRLNCPPEGCMSFFEALYFMIVTVSTVGYGDVTLKSDWGRVVILCAIVSALVILPSQINDILHLASRRPYGGCFAVKKVVGSRFIIVSGDLSFRTIQDFLAEFYHPNHNKDMRAFPLRVVIMAPFKPSFALKSLLMYYKGKVEFIEGTPVKNSDLNRVSANVASAFYLLGNQLAQDPDAEDAAQIVRALSVHRHCGATVRVIVELLKPERQENAIWDDMREGIEIICPDAIRFKLLARSCHIRGLTTFLVNLFRTGLTMARPNAWMEQYCYGLRQEVFPLILPDCFHREGLLFEQVVELAYCRYGVILFGLDIATVDCDSNLSREILMCPIGRLIQRTDVGLVIAKNLETAELLSKFGKFTTDSDMGDEKMTCFPHTQSKLCGPKLSSKASEEALLLQRVKSSSGRGASRDVEAASHDAESTPTRAKLAQYAKRFVDPRDHQAKKNVDSHSIEAVTDETISANAPPHSSSKWGSHSNNSLEEAVDIAMSWPPVVKCTKPEQPVLERQAQKIFENLAERTLHMVKLQDSHILLCIQGAWPVSLFYFIEQLRRPIVPNPPIVILHPNDPNASDWGCVGLFEHVYFVKGSPIYELDLVRAGVLQAEKVVILSQGKQLEQPSLEIANDQDRFHPGQTFSLDVNNLIIAATVERLSVQSSRVIVELQQEAEIQYLRPKLRFDGQCFYPGMYRRNQAAKFQFSPSYIEGKGFCPATLGFLMYSTFYNRRTVAIVEQLISGSVSAEISEDNSDTIKQKDIRKLNQIHVPKQYVGQTFIELFVGLLREEGTIALGLYRDKGTNGSLISFVYTNPQADTPLFHCDLVYILH